MKKVDKIKFLMPRIICKIKNYKLVRFKLNNGKIFPLLYVRKPKKPLIAFKAFLGILIDDLFYKLDEDMQKSTIWHEIYHTKALTGIKFFFLLPFKKLFIKRKRSYNFDQLEEFDADEYALKKTDFSSILRLFYKLEQMEMEGLIKINLKNHPPIKDRITNIKFIDKKFKKLKNETPH